VTEKSLFAFVAFYNLISEWNSK